MTLAPIFRIKVATGLFLLLSIGQLDATLTQVQLDAFGAGSSLLTFDALAIGTEMNSLTVSGVTFQVTLSGTPTDGQVQIGLGPGVTDNLSTPNIVSIANPDSLALTVILPTLSKR